jgi:hypothetical protein
MGSRGGGVCVLRRGTAEIDGVCRCVLLMTLWPPNPLP